jgi:hypothetical protein
MACAGFPCLGSLTDGPWMAFEPVVRVRKVFGAHCSWPGPLTTVFPFSHTETNFEIMKPHFCCSTIYQTFQSNRPKDKEQLSFWEQVQIPNKI